MRDQEARALVAKLKDPKFFIERFFWIVDKQGKKVPFIFNNPQNLYYKSKTNNDLILKSRKEGFSSEIEAECIHACLTVPNTKAVTMAHTLDDTRVHMDRIKFYLHTMGTENFKFNITLEKENQMELFFPELNSHYWTGTAGSRKFGRGRDITLLHLSEISHFENQEVVTAVLGACTDNARKIFETTANGEGELFNLLWTDACDPAYSGPWKPHFFSWFEDPSNRAEVPANFRMNSEEKEMIKRYPIDENQLYWYHRKMAELPDKSLMKQEYPCDAQEAFISTGRRVFDVQCLNEMYAQAKPPTWQGDIVDNGDEIRFVDNPSGPLEIWKKPDTHGEYLISADVAQGVSDGAYSVAVVWDRETWEIVAQWRGRVNPDEFGKVMALMGWFWNSAIVAPENNNHGWASIVMMREMGYTHVLEAQHVLKDYPSDIKGFPTNLKTKPLIISNMQVCVSGLRYLDPSNIAINETRRCIWNESNEMVAKTGFTDTVMARAIGLFCLRYYTVTRQHGHIKRKDQFIVQQLFGHKENRQEDSISKYNRFNSGG